jgi:N-acetylornithine carbamoyltransferase
MRQASFFGRDLLNTQDWSRPELEQILELAVKLKHLRQQGEETLYLAHQTLYLLFFFTSTRTRASFEAAMDQLGGNSHDLVPEQLQIGHGDTSQDIGRILSSYGDGIAIRQCDWQQGNRYINEVAHYAQVPVFNMQCDKYHPFQALADLLTILEEKKTLKGKKIVMSWAYAQSYTKPISVPQSFLLLLSQFGADLTLACPKEFALMPEVMTQVKANLRRSHGSLELTDDMAKAFSGADVVYPKSWGPLVMTADPQRCTQIAGKYQDWICNETLMRRAKKEAIYLHCLPADRGKEVTSAVIDGPQSRVYQQAENRLHVQKAVLSLTMRKRGKE